MYFQFKHVIEAAVLLWLAPLNVAHAKDEAPEPRPAAVEAAEDEPDGKGRSLAVIPGVFYSQETSVGFAALGIYTFPLNGTGEETWPSSVTATLVYTVKNQASVSVWSSFYLGEANDWAIETQTFAEHFPTNYYGIGPSSEPSYEVFTRRQIAADLTLRRRVKGPFYLGLADHFSFVDILDVQNAAEPDGSSPVVWTNDDQLVSGNVTGGDGTRTHGVGLLARWDTRDNNQSTRSGLLVDLELAGYPRWLGGIEPFAMGTLDIRGFVPVWRGTLAGQLRAELGAGDIPFTSMPELGGDSMLRGMYQGRFRDQNAISGQVEFRHPIVWRFSGVGFVGLGQVATTPDLLFARKPRWTAGGGLRFLIDEDARTAVRLDMGGGPDGAGLILTFGEAF